MKEWMIMLLAGARGLLQSAMRVILPTFDRLRSIARANRSIELSDLQRQIEGLAAQFNELKRELVTAVPTIDQSRSGLNLSKRSQALRMHGRGDTALQIAAALEVPVPEIKLLVKVHHIVTSSR